jgi:4-amino-4-deoxy-L-arabinose transferase-like glycosyltransferase
MTKQLKNAIIIAVIFGAVFAAFGLLSPQIWNSPDETAVAFFSRNMAATGQLFRVEAYNLFQSDIIHPRSIISIDGYLVPGSFYGAIFFFGLFYKFIGPVAFSLGTPLATALAGVCVFFLIRRLYDERRAMIAEVLFLANPAVWYFASRGLFPNLLFVDLAIIGTAILYLQPWQAAVKGRGNRFLGASIDVAVGMFVLGAAFLVRPVEFIWLAPILIAVYWFARKSVSWFKIAVGAAVAAAFVVVLLYTNSHLYGGFLSFGYTAGSTAPGVSVPALSAPSRLPSFLSAPRPFILPFGLHPRLAITNLWNYLALFAWWLPALAAVGYLLTKDRANRRRFSRCCWWVAIVLGVYYGSGIFVDSSVSQWTIGSSYIRYFLPAFILLVPLAAEGVDRLARKKRWLAPSILGVFAALSLWTVYFRSPESPVPMRATLVYYA